MVERFNRRLSEHLDRLPQNHVAHHRRFADHAERDAYLHTFVTNYNQTRLRCIGYLTPSQLLTNLTEQNTKAGVQAFVSPACTGLTKDGVGCRGLCRHMPSTRSTVAPPVAMPEYA